MSDKAPVQGYPGENYDHAWRELVFPDDHCNPQPRRRYHLVVIGAGPVGCELAQAMARLEIEVHLFEMADRVLVAAGRRANVEDLSLDRAGIEVRDGLVVVDDKLRTTNKRVFAAGDVCSRLQLTHHADAHARIVVRNALFGPTAGTRELVIPQCTYTDPEIAEIGKSEEKLEQEGIPFDSYRVEIGELDRSKTQGDPQGFVRVLTAKGRDAILGATIVGHDAGEQIAPLCLAMPNGLGLGALGKAVLPYPTRSEYLRRLADEYNRTRLTLAARALMKTWFQYAGR